MVVTDEAGLVSSLQELVGDGLRVVATFDRSGYDVLFSRNDVAARLHERGPAVHDDLVLQGLGLDHLEDLFGAGDLECSMHRFDEATVFHFRADEFSGLFVSIDSESDVQLVTFADTCVASMDG